MWKTKSNQLIHIHEMTDLHLENAVKYIENGKGKWQDLEILKEEQLRRKLKNFECKCQFCKKTMIVKKFRNDPEDSWLEWSYRLNCDCGAMGPEIDIYKLK